MNEYVIGIDIGSSKVCAAAGRLDKNSNLQIAGVVSVACQGIKRGIIVDIDNTAVCIRNCVEQLEGILDIKITEALIAIPGGITELIPNKGVVAISSDDKEIRKVDLERVIKSAKIINIPKDKEIIGVIPQQYIIDGYDNIKDPVGMCGSRLEIEAQIILAKTTIINNLFKSVNKAGIKVNALIYEPQAVSELTLHKDETDIGTAVIDAGAETINISIYRKGILCFNDVLNLGGSTITNDIAVCLKIPFSEAEKLKVSYGKLDYMNERSIKLHVNSNYNKEADIESSLLNQIIQARVDEIFQLILSKVRTSGYYDEISGVVLVGSGLSMFDKIEEQLRDTLKKPVRISEIEYAGISNQAYAGAIGIINNYFKTTKSNYVNVNQKESNHNKAWPVDNDDDEKYETEKPKFINKIKDFFTDFF